MKITPDDYRTINEHCVERGYRLRVEMPTQEQIDEFRVGGKQCAPAPYQKWNYVYNPEEISQPPSVTDPDYIKKCNEAAFNQLTYEEWDWVI